MTIHIQFFGNFIQQNFNNNKKTKTIKATTGIEL